MQYQLLDYSNKKFKGILSFNDVDLQTNSKQRHEPKRCLYRIRILIISVTVITNY